MVRKAAECFSKHVCRHTWATTFCCLPTNVPTFLLALAILLELKSLIYAPVLNSPVGETAYKSDIKINFSCPHFPVLTVNRVHERF